VGSRLRILAFQSLKAIFSLVMNTKEERFSAVETGLNPVVQQLPTTGATWFEQLFRGLHIPGEIQTPRGEVVRFGEGVPRFRIKVHSEDIFRHPQDELTLGEAYVDGKIDLEGDMQAILEVRSQLAEQFRMRPWLRFMIELFLTPATRVNKKVISRHYNLGNDFYVAFLDSKYRFYSHCLFAQDDETLEQAAEHKLETAFRALDLQPGMRLLDIGAGWGGVFEYGCPRGIHVTGVTTFEDSYRYVKDLMQRNNFSGEIILQDFLTYHPQEPFDAIVIYGVIEHIPYYRRFFERVWECLKPGGKIYIDGSASKEKYSLSQFARRYLWQGAHSCMCLQEVVREALYHGFQVEEVKEESHDYELTMLHWAQRLDSIREKLVAGWGEEIYRAFRLYLWGGVHAFRTDRLQAYHVVARRGPSPGPRPGPIRRLFSFARDVV
jgi:cyclopropane-fatty-acyl-phospholipid synthase